MPAQRVYYPSLTVAVGLRFDEATARAIGKAEARHTRSGRIALWVIALIAVLIWGSTWGVDVDRWTLVCAIGALLGIPGLVLVMGRRARQRRRGQA